MEAATTAVVRSSFAISRSSISGSRSGFVAASRPDFVRFCAKSQLPIKHFSSMYSVKRAHNRFTSKRSMVVRASSSPESAGSSIAPLRLESPVGQLLSQILVSHPHLLPSAVEQQLEQLQTDRDSEEKKEESPVSGTELVLYRRIAEVKANERRKVLEEILYTLIVQRFMDADVSLIPSISLSSMVDQQPSQDKKLELLHSQEAYEMIQNHLTLILGNRVGDTTSVAQVSKLRIGQVYAASVMYGYFLKRVDQRFQLEKAMKVLGGQSDGDVRPSADEDAFETAEIAPMGPGGIGQRIKPSRLRSYVMSFDGDTLQRYGTIRSKEAVSIIEKHTEALFGRPEIAVTAQGGIDSSKDELIKISFGGLKRLVLEAVTFGSFLWDVESYADARYHFVSN